MIQGKRLTAKDKTKTSDIALWQCQCFQEQCTLGGACPHLFFFPTRFLLSVYPLYHHWPYFSGIKYLNRGPFGKLLHSRSCSPIIQTHSQPHKGTHASSHTPNNPYMLPASPAIGFLNACVRATIRCLTLAMVQFIKRATQPLCICL